ncbi:MAG: chemotaxis protein CheX [Bryobacteraceae bacterium]
MPAALTLKIYLDDLERIVQSVFRTMMDLEAAAAPDPWTHAPDTITAAVNFVGEWRGATLVECRAPQACEFAARFMGIDMPATIDDDVRDVMGELANMVAGNLKSLLPRGVDLSMPTVVEGTNYTLRICGAGAMEPVTFASPAGNFRVTLVETLQPI